MPGVSIGDLYGQRSVVVDGPHDMAGREYWFVECECGDVDFVTEGMIAAPAHDGRCPECRSTRRWTEINVAQKRIRTAASSMVNTAVAQGAMVRPECCDDCGRGNRRIEGHHDDYSRPLDVRWLCVWCHSKAHRENREAQVDSFAAFRHVIGNTMPTRRARSSLTTVQRRIMVQQMAGC